MIKSFSRRNKKLYINVSFLIKNRSIKNIKTISHIPILSCTVGTTNCILYTIDMYNVSDRPLFHVVLFFQ